MLPWVLCGVLAALVMALLGKVCLLQKGMDEIGGQMGERLEEDTNNLLFLSTRDRHARRLAAELNRQLRLLRRQRRRYLNGDRELKEAVTNISHDLRTPLTAVCGYLELLEREELTPAQRRYVAMIGERTQAMKGLTEELFRYSVVLSEEELTPEEVCLNAALEESLAGFYAAFREKGIVPRVKTPQERLLRQLDQTALSRVLGNILGNVLKYSPGDLEVELKADGEMVFTNTAPGLDEVEVGRLFDRFYTVETGRGSTGLGLSIARTLAERMGGEIGASYCCGRLSIRLRF